MLRIALLAAIVASAVALPCTYPVDPASGALSGGAGFWNGASSVANVSNHHDNWQISHVWYPSHAEATVWVVTAKLEYMRLHWRSLTRPKLAHRFGTLMCFLSR